MSFVRTVYQNVFRRTSTFAVAVVLGAFMFERAFDQGGDYLFHRMNQGKLWLDIKHKYEKIEEEE